MLAALLSLAIYSTRPSTSDVLMSCLSCCWLLSEALNKGKSIGCTFPLATVLITDGNVFVFTWTSCLLVLGQLVVKQGQWTFLANSIQVTSFLFLFLGMKVCLQFYWFLISGVLVCVCFVFIDKLFFLKHKWHRSAYICGKTVFLAMPIRRKWKAKWEKSLSSLLTKKNHLSQFSWLSFMCWCSCMANVWAVWIESGYTQKPQLSLLWSLLYCRSTGCVHQCHWTQHILLLGSTSGNLGKRIGLCVLVQNDVLTSFAEADFQVEGVCSIFYCTAFFWVSCQ